MAYTVEGLSLAGLRKAHLRQLACYIRNRDTEGWYYGPRDQNHGGRHGRFLWHY